jgi:hypothetical protein
MAKTPILRNFILLAVFVPSFILLSASASASCPSDWQSSHPEWIVCEDWDIGTLPSSTWPDCGGPSWRGWTPKECTDGPGESNVVSNIAYSGTRSFRATRPAGANAATDLYYSFSAEPRIYLAAYMYLPADYANPDNCGEDLIHFIFANSARSYTGPVIDLFSYTDYQPDSWPPLCAEPWAIYVGFSNPSRSHSMGAGDISGCFNLRANTGAWHHYEFMWDLPNQNVKMWVDGVLKIDRAQDQGWSAIDLIIISGWSSSQDSSCLAKRNDFYFDDVIISTERIGYSGGTTHTCSQLGGTDCCTSAETCPGSTYSGASDCSGTCCSQTCAAIPACPQGQITSRCLCGGTAYSSGYCCSGSWQSSACSTQTCGNNIREGTEACDGTDLAGQTCISRGFAGGILRCLSSCAGFDTISCTSPSGTVTESWGDSIGSNHPGTVEDTFLNQGAEWGYIISNADISLHAFTWPDNMIANTILMRFNLASMPQSARIQNANLQLYQYEWDTDKDSSYELTVHKVINRNPVFSQANGYYYSGTTPWTAVTQSGSYYQNSLGYLCCNENTPMALNDIEAPADRIYSDRTAGYKSWNITSLVQSWVSNPSQNYGLLIVPEDNTPADSYRFFYSSEYANANQRPKITITYSASSALASRADNNPADGCVSSAELTAFISRWFTSNQDVTMAELMQAIGLWKSGAGCA